MGHIIAYFIILYSLIAIVISSKNIIREQKYITLVLLLTLPIVPYIFIETQTILFKNQIVSTVEETIQELGSPSTQLLKLKILSISKERARIYAIHLSQLSPDVPNAIFCEPDIPCMCYGGDVIYLRKISKGWKFNGDYSAVWSDCGSADSNIFPPYFSKGDYGD